MRNNEKGQALLLVVVALSVFLLGAIGLALDGAQLYAHRQMAQAAADAAAQAGLFSIFAGTVTCPPPSKGGCVYTNHTCAAADLSTTTPTQYLSACTYAQTNGFMTADDAVVISYPSSPYNGVTGTTDSKFPQPFVQVAITRAVHTTLMQFLGSSTCTIGGTLVGNAACVLAIGGAGIVQELSPVPIIVLDLTGSPSFSLSGNPNIEICGGPQRSIQVNSREPGAISVNGTKATVNLSLAGPADSGTCTTGTGGDFGVFGSTPGFPSWLTPVGTTEHYDQPSPPISDPLSGVAEPAQPTTNGTITSTGTGTTAGSGDCPATAGPHGCTIYTPGYYATGIQVSNSIAIFQPGIYWMDGSKSHNNGFSTGANGDVIMCSTTCVADISGCCANNGMLVYLGPNSGPVSVGANSASSLLGSSPTSSYEGILFFVSREAADQSPNLGGGGGLTLVGTLYMPTQTLSFGGNSGSSTTVKGEIIVNDLSMGGTPNIKMELDPNYKLPVDQIALVR